MDLVFSWCGCSTKFDPGWIAGPTVWDTRLARQCNISFEQCDVDETHAHTEQK